ncbi:MAG: alpha/beta fold hydrolase [Pararhodobacter sp.]
MGSGASWGPVAAALAGAVDLRGFDMPGHGRSGPWVSGMGAPGMGAPGADDPDYHTAVTRIAAAMIERPLDLIGHSFGATIALRIAVAAPDAVRSLTLIEPVLFAAAPSAVQDALNDRLSELLAGGQEAEATRAFLSVWGVNGGEKLSPAALALMRRQIGLVAQTSGALRDDHANILREGGLEAVDAPVLLVAGANSPPVIHAIADALAARLPDVGRATVPGAGHMLPLTHPQPVAGLIGVNLERS